MLSSSPVVGVDIGKNFSCYCILKPNGQVYIESFKEDNSSLLNWILT